MAHLRYQLFINRSLVRPQFYQTVNAAKFLVQISLSSLRRTRGIFGINYGKKREGHGVRGMFSEDWNSFLHVVFLTGLHWLSSLAYHGVCLVFS